MIAPEPHVLFHDVDPRVAFPQGPTLAAEENRGEGRQTPVPAGYLPLPMDTATITPTTTMAMMTSRTIPSETSARGTAGSIYNRLSPSRGRRRC